MTGQLYQRPSAQAPAAEKQESLVSIIQQLKQLGVISLPGQQNNDIQDSKKRFSSHRQTCPQNEDKPVNPACLKHGEHAQAAQRALVQWQFGGSADQGRSYRLFLDSSQMHTLIPGFSTPSRMASAITSESIRLHLRPYRS